ncbi:MAG: fibronectin type III domain-containing protein, partial [Actinomycetota bacterium]|nr:fibronectin type III domain-containing protein [Actinomycetota bacterium]
MHRRRPSTVAELILLAGTGSAAVALAVGGVLSPASAFAAGAPGTSQLTTPMHDGRSGTATLLADGRVLVVDAQPPDTQPSPHPAEVYDPTTQTWTETPAADTARAGSSATLLADGRVLVAGGFEYSGGTTGASLYNPADNSWTSTEPMGVPRLRQAAVRLPSGKVLVAGSGTEAAYDSHPTAETYDPATGRWTSAGSPPPGTEKAVLLASGRVLALAPTSAATYDPTTGLWQAAASPPHTVGGSRSVRLQTGQVLLAGGYADYFTDGRDPLVYDETTDSWRAAGHLLSRHQSATATLLADGEVALVGGDDAGSSVELYDPATDLWRAGGTTVSSRSNHTATLLGTGTVLLAGGSNPPTTSAELYTPPAAASPAGPGSTSGTPTDLLVNASPVEVHPGRETVITARLLTASARDPVRGEPVSLWKRPATGGTWSAIGSGPTDADGAVSFRDSPTESAVYAARHPGTGSYGQSGSPDLSVSLVPQSAPGPPAGGSEAGDGNILVTWDPPRDDGGAPITGYTVQPSGQSRGQFAPVHLDGSARWTRISGLSNGTTYLMQVTATNALGTGMPGFGGNSTPMPGPSPASPPPPAPGAKCGSLPFGTTVWNASGSPYHLCPHGVVVPSGATLVLDGSQGPVQVHADGLGGILLDGGSLRTEGTSATSPAVLAGPRPGPATWSGITAAGESAPYQPDRRSSVVLDLGWVQMSGSAPSIVLGTFVRAHDLTVTGGSIHVRDTPARLSGIHVSGSPGFGVRLTCSGTCAQSLTDATIDAAQGSGLIVQSTQHPVVRNVSVTRSGTSAPAQPAVFFDDVTASIGPGRDVDGLAGGGNGIDAALLAGHVTADLAWVSPVAAASVHPLGYLLGNLTMAPGTTLRVPAGGVVMSKFTGGLVLDGARLDATAGGAVFTVAGDRSVGIDACWLASPQCVPTRGDWYGVLLQGDKPAVDVVGATVRYASVAFASPIYPTTRQPSFRISSTTVQTCGAAVSTDQSDSPSAGGTLIVSALTVRDCTGGVSAQRVASASVVDSTFSLSNTGGSFVGVDGINVSAADDAAPLTLLRDSITGADGMGVYVKGTHPQVHQLSVRASGFAHGSVGSSAAVVLDVTGGVGPGSDVDGITGSGNAVNAINIGGTLTSDLVWVTPAQASTDQPLGYIHHGLIVPVGRTVLLPAGAVVKSGAAIDVRGGRVDGSAGGAVLTSPADLRITTTPCPGCPPLSPGTPLLSVRGDDTTGRHGSLSLVRAQLLDGGSIVGLDGGDTNLDHLTVERGTIEVGGTASETLTAVDVSGGGRVRIIQPTHAVVDGLTVRDAAYGALLVEGRGSPEVPSHPAAPQDDIVLHHVVVTGAGKNNRLGIEPAVLLKDLWASIGPGQQIDDIQGGGNTADAILLDHVAVAGDLTWISPVNGDGLHALGYGVHNGLSMGARATLSVPANGVVKANGYVHLHGATLDARAGGAILTGLDDNSVGSPFCPAELGCRADGIKVVSDFDRATGTPGGVAVAKATVRGGLSVEGAGTAPGNPAYGLVVEGSLVVARGDLNVNGLSATGTPARIVNTTVRDGSASIAITNSSGSLLTDLTVRDNDRPGISVTDATVDLERTAVTRTGTAAPAPYGPSAAILVQGSSGGTFSCLGIEGNRGGLAVLGQPLTVTDSNLDHNTTGGFFDLSDRAPVTTRRMWWGQPGGPVPGQVEDASKLSDSTPSSARSACAPVVAPVAPDAPTGVLAAAGKDSATVSWTAPDAGGSPITSYRLTASPGGRTADVSGTTTTATVSGLTAGTSYTFAVVATNAVGSGPPSTASNAVVPTADPPGPPTNVTA